VVLRAVFPAGQILGFTCLDTGRNSAAITDCAESGEFMDAARQT
jgi:hypothetical protein